MDPRCDVECRACGWRGRRDPDDEYLATVLTEEWQPGDILGEVFGNCDCGEPVTLAWPGLEVAA